MADNIGTEVAKEGVKGGLSKGSKWLIGSLGAGVVGFTTVIATAGGGGPAKMSTSAPTAQVAQAAATDTGRVGKRNASTKGAGAVAGDVGDGGTSVNDRLSAQEMNMEALRNDMLGIQRSQAQMSEEVLRRVAAMQEAAEKAASARTTPHVDLPPLMRPARPNERFTGEYQTKVSHFKGNRSTGWAMGDGEVKGLLASLMPPPRPAEPVTLSQDGRAEVPVTVGQYEYIIPAGSRIMAVTEQPVNSDHPGFFTSRVVRPEILRGAHLICQQGGQQNNRIPVEVVKVIFKDTEYMLSGQVENNFPGVTGKVNRHYVGRAVPILVNAAITGGFVAWSAQNRGSDRIDTRDAITAEVVSQTLPQVQNEIATFAVPRPATVEVPAGAQFSILLTNKLTVRY